MKIDLNNLKIRYLVIGDGEVISSWALSPEVAAGFAVDFDDMISRNDFGYRWAYMGSVNAGIGVELDGELIAAASLWLNSSKNIKHTSLFGVIVKKEYQNRGVGTLIVNNIIDLGFSRFNLKSIFLSYASDNVAAARIYKKFGFKYEFSQKDFFFRGNNEYADCITMSLKRG